MNLPCKIRDSIQGACVRLIIACLSSLALWCFISSHLMVACPQVPPPPTTSDGPYSLDSRHSAVPRHSLSVSVSPSISLSFSASALPLAVAVDVHSFHLLYDFQYSHYSLSLSGGDRLVRLVSRQVPSIILNPLCIYGSSESFLGRRLLTNYTWRATRRSDSGRGLNHSESSQSSCTNLQSFQPLHASHRVADESIETYRRDQVDLVLLSRLQLIRED